MDKVTESKFLMFENQKNNCWLDASVALIAHNETIKKIVKRFPESQILEIISTFDRAMTVLNDSESSIEHRMKRTREMLANIQNGSLQYLQQFLKYKDGEPDSAFCAVLNLICHDDSDIKEHLSATWMWKKMCTNCGNRSKTSLLTKPIITLSKVSTFQPECPTSIYKCTCDEKQEMQLIYKALPSCLIFHFENGAGDGKNLPLTFTFQGRNYHLTGVITLEKSSDPNLNHFITYIREPFHDMWLDCNDLNTNIASFCSQKPEFNLKDVYMYVFESFDNLDKIYTETFADQEQDIENLNVEVIDLSDEAEETKNILENIRLKSSSPKLSQNSLNTKSSTNNSIQNSIKNDMPKEEALVSKEADKLAAITNQDLKDHGNGSETNKPKAPIDYSKVPASNIRVALPVKSSTQYKSHLMNIKDKVSSVFSGTKHTSSLNMNKGKDEFSKVSRSNNKSVASNTAELHTDENSYSGKTNLTSMATDGKATEMDCSFQQKNDPEMQLPKWKHFHFRASMGNLKEREHSGQQSSENSKDVSIQLDQQQNINTSKLHKTVLKPDSKTVLNDGKLQVKQQVSTEQIEENSSCLNLKQNSGESRNVTPSKESSHRGRQHCDLDSPKTYSRDNVEDDENELQLKLQQVSLRRLRNPKRKRNTDLTADEKTTIVDEVKKMSVKKPRRRSQSKSPKRRRGRSMSSNKGSDSSDTTKQNLRSLRTERSRTPSCVKEKMAKDVEDLVHKVVTSTFLVFVGTIKGHQFTD